MKRLAKITRVLTIAPIMALCLVIILYISDINVFNNIIDLLVCLFSIVIIPPLAYIVQWIFKIYKTDQRSGERKLAIIFSLVSYTFFLVYALVSDTCEIYKVLASTYFVSGLLIFISSFILKNNASGHMCGVSGPVAMLFFSLGGKWIVAFVLLLLVGWSSLYLKRHTFVQLIRGTLIPIVALLISIMIF